MNNPDQPDKQAVVTLLWVIGLTAVNVAVILLAAKWLLP